MSIQRFVQISLYALGLAGLTAIPVVARQQTGSSTMAHEMPMTKAGGMMTAAQKIANAMTAAPSSISAKATVLDWPAKEGAAPEMLRKGNNGWTCFPDMPDSKGNDPMCVDDTWMKWIDAYLSHKAPQTSVVGIGYMLAPGGGWASNTDPYAMKETPDNHWGHHEPHMMILVPDVKTLSGLSTDPNNGGPYVMFPGTPYAHIMAPTSTTPMPAMSRK